MPYVIEYAVSSHSVFPNRSLSGGKIHYGGTDDFNLPNQRSNRASCQGTCKGNIENGELRLGSKNVAEGFTRTAWRHFPGCITSRLAKNVTQEIKSPEKLDGFSALNKEDQVIVKRSFEKLLAGEEVDFEEGVDDSAVESRKRTKSPWSHAKSVKRPDAQTEKLASKRKRREEHPGTRGPSKQDAERNGGKGAKSTKNNRIKSSRKQNEEEDEEIEEEEILEDELEEEEYGKEDYEEGEEEEDYGDKKAVPHQRTHRGSKTPSKATTKQAQTISPTRKASPQRRKSAQY
jgi:hypothetical protein